ncbi:MAG: antitoxin [Chloroflexota bacterium]|nr:antitoxin [Chloroflexota bacterium]
MRTTVTIDDDVLAVARALAERKGSSLGGALSELARRGFKSELTHSDVADGTTFPAPADAEPITSEDVYRSLDDWP